MTEGNDAAWHTAELIRLHREAIFPLSSVPAEEQEIEFRACEQMPDEPAMNEEEMAMCDAGTDTTMIRPARHAIKANPGLIHRAAAAAATPKLTDTGGRTSKTRRT